MMDEKAYREKCGKINSRYNLLGSSVMDITAEQHGIYKWFKFTYILLFNTFSQKQRKKMILSTAVKNGLKEWKIFAICCVDFASDFHSTEYTAYFNPNLCYAYMYFHIFFRIALHYTHFIRAYRVCNVFTLNLIVCWFTGLTKFIHLRFNPKRKMNLITKFDRFYKYALLMWLSK